MQDQNETKAHPFQRTLGLGPYKFVGVFELGKAIAALNAGNVSGHNNMMMNAPRLKAGMGTCAHCNMAITFVCIVQTGNGELFGVGSDCINKVDMPAKEVTKLDKIKRERSKMQRAALKAKKGDAARLDLKTMIDSMSNVLDSKNHPTRSSLTLLDYAKWTLEHSSDGGIVFALKRIRGLL